MYNLIQFSLISESIQPALVAFQQVLQGRHFLAWTNIYDQDSPLNLVCAIIKPNLNHSMDFTMKTYLSWAVWWSRVAIFSIFLILLSVKILLKISMTKHNSDDDNCDYPDIHLDWHMLYFSVLDDNLIGQLINLNYN